ncbi:O-antigen ligase family protein [Paenibacillus wynnii]|uniref:O-antigen ligase-related domain-containing protein n=1 Tax=Paenibacillus wynnii TaxID=268407 RepID=A0A098MFX2_9BACL|nr:O-antigen ligase family protein [Paenibacillus wynnii]KGE20951.1 hypothetical protein PWYN_01980 [Paenibacillus wynnii]
MLNNKFKGYLNTLVMYISAAAVIVAGGTAILRHGFFFAEDIYAFAGGWFILGALLILVRLVASISKESAVSLMGTVNWWRNRSAIAILSAPFLIAVLYALSWLREPVSFQGTMNELLRWSLYGTFAVLAFISTKSKGSTWIITVAWHIVGMALSLSALAVVCGGLSSPYFIAYSDNPGVSATGARLAGLLQYPNTFGAVMAVFLLERLFAVSEYNAGRTGVELSGTGSRGAGWNGTGNRGAGWSGAKSTGAARSNAGNSGADRSGIASTGAGNPGTKRAGAAMLHLLPLFPYTAALLLSESRGAWLAAACAGAAVLPLKRRLLVPLLAAGAAPVAAAALLYRQLAAARLAVEPLPGLLALAGLWAGALLAGLWICRRQRSVAGGVRAAVLGLAALCWTAGAAAVLQQVQARITEPSSTVSARALLYRDAWRLAAEAPWLGRGGETWRSMYLAAQSHPYVGSQIHSGYLDILLNLGIAGLVVVIVMLFAMCWLVAVSLPRLLPPFLVIVLHGAVDFDWSYGLIWILLFWLLALAVANARETQPTLAGIQPDIIAKRRGRFSTRTSSKLIFALVICCSSLVLCIISWRAQSAAELYREAVILSNPVERIMLLQQSLHRNPLSPRAAAILSEDLSQAQSKKVLVDSLMYSPDNPALNWNMAELMMHEDRVGGALYWVRRSLRLDVYNFKKRTNAIHAMLLLGERRLAAGDKEGARLSASSGLELLREYKLLTGGAGSKEYNDRSFHLTDQAINLGQQLDSLMMLSVTAG